MRPGQRDIRISSEMAVLFDEARSNAFYFTIWSRDGTQLKRSTNAPPDVPLPERLARDTRTHTRRRDAYRESYHFTELEDCVLAGRTLSVHFSAMRRFTFWLLAAGGTVLVFGLGGGWWLTTRAIRPVEEISAAASRISAGNLSERISEAHADNELGRLAGVLNSTFAQDRGIQIHCHLAPAEAFINAGHLGLILTNLLTNAIHYNKPKGEIRVSTRLENGAAVLTVADSGIGISAENLPHVFERFYRADKSRSRAEGHSGLGLAICQAMVEAHDGSIDASSQLGVGTTFTVRRPDAPSL
jgi:nitrogen fixation/metabolism regulation signal transduction histidine kinase